ncbi:extracellular solute-binding protein [Paenibacillus sp. 1P07SE]|uniref:extracellular solute-binding protein n=1 Tax=Paenibacillus sp. 1P07SE TaxID=3132209 RepID=UPI0039A6FF77
MALLLSACSGNATNEPAGANEPASPGPDNTGTTAEIGYPGELTYWVPLNANVSATMKSAAEIAAYQEIEKATGTKVSFQHPPQGQEADAFNLMVSSGNLPDVIQHNWSGVAGGPDKAIADGTIIRLNELIEAHAPNLSKLLDEHPEYRKLVTTDDGNIYVFPFIRGDDYLLTYNGLILRQDWLDSLQLSVPETIDEWYEVLQAIKTGDPNGNGQPDEIPLLIDVGMTALNQAFVGAWGITDTFYQVDGEVHYGPTQPEFKEYLATMNKWYAEGLIDADYAATDGKLKDAKVTNNQLGAFVGYTGSSIGRYADLMKDSHPEFALTGAPNVVLNKGDRPLLGQKEAPFSGIGAAITASNPNPEATVKWLDYNYGEEGHMLFNFGIEGVSYELVDGYPTYTDEVMNNPELPITQAMAKYMLANYSGPFVQDRRYMEQYSALPAQQEAITTWMEADNERWMPTLSPTAEESSRYASIMNDVKTYYDEMVNKFIMGVEPLDNFDKFADTLRGMGIEEAIQIQQAGLDRFNSRE